MTVPPIKPRSLEGTRGRIVKMLRKSGLTANEIAARLAITHNAVRAQLATLQRDGLVHEGGMRKSGTRPAIVYELSPAADFILSRAYIPFVAHLVRVLGEHMSPKKLDEVMRTVGRRLAAEWPRLRGDLRQRVKGAAALLEELGAPNVVERSDEGLVIRGYGCLLAAAVHGRPEVCRSIESLLAELVEVPVRECCQRGDRPRCCFKISSGESSAPPKRRAGQRGE